jgi:hypothetical protein
VVVGPQGFKPEGEPERWGVGSADWPADERVTGCPRRQLLHPAQTHGPVLFPCPAGELVFLVRDRKYGAQGLNRGDDPRCLDMLDGMSHPGPSAHILPENAQIVNLGAEALCGCCQVSAGWELFHCFMFFGVQGE